ncbi:MAG: DUF1624 domain-containing protein [Rhodobacteraceae bacterium]|nr:DUF1624 domain-containing protein [Paracoccaceae bacterium]
MAAFHLTYDLQLFGFLPPGTVSSGFWYVEARLVAGSFLFFAGVSLWLAHGGGFRRAAFLRRLATIAAAALAVTVATRIVLPGHFVYFGILHSIATASVIGVLALRLPAPINLALAALVLALARIAPLPGFDHPAFWPTGLSRTYAAAVDYVPLVPWLAPFLAGLGLARIAGTAGLFGRLARRPAPGPILARLAWLGRHSLAVYLIHQPVLFGAVWLAARLRG